jgi:hypothetical protein
LEAGEEIGKAAPRIGAVELAGFDEGHDRRPLPTA